MTTASIYQPRTASPMSFGLVLLIHGAAISALVLARMEMPVPPDFTPTDVRLIPVKPPPEEMKPEPKTELPTPQIRHIDPLVPPPPRPPEEQMSSTRTEQKAIDPGPAREAEPVREPPPPPPPAAVRKAARLDPRSDLKPDYPLSERRAGTEGTVTVRIAIGADGKVIRAEKVRATNDAFFRATQQHALRNWRFRPATLDGRPVESSTVMTVHFTLEGEDA